MLIGSSNMDLGSGNIKEGRTEELMELLSPDFALINPKKIFGTKHLFQAATLSQKAHSGKYNFSRERSTEVLLYLTAQRQISKAIEIAGIDETSKSVAWVSFSDIPQGLFELIEPEPSLLDTDNFDYSDLEFKNSKKGKLSIDQIEKIIMTRTAALPVQSR